MQATPLHSLIEGNIVQADLKAKLARVFALMPIVFLRPLPTLHH